MRRKFSAHPHCLVTLLTLLLALPILSTDIYLPSFNVIKKSLHANEIHVQFTLTAYFFIVSIVQLLYGFLSDRFGRRPLLLLSLCIYITASLWCAFASTIQILILGRCLQALGAGSAILTFAIIRDLYDGQHVAKLIAYMSAVVALSPIVAPIMGGYIQLLLSWRWDFIILAVIGVILLSLCYVLLPETNNSQSNTTSFLKPLDACYSFLFRNRHYISNALAAAFAFAALFAYVSGAPHIFLNLMGYSPQLFGWLFAIATIGYVIGAFVNGKLISHFGIDFVYRIGIGSFVSGAIIMTLLCFISPLYGIAIAISQLLCEFGIAIVIAISITQALQPIPNLAGTGSALIGFLRFLCATFSSYLTAAFQGTTPLPLALIILGFSLLALFCLHMQNNKPAKTNFRCCLL